MTARIPTACRKTGCPNSSTPGSSLCREHQTQEPPSLKRTRHYLETNPHYNNMEWIRIRDQIKAQHPTCQLCGVRPSELIHHILPIAQGGTNDLDNLLAVCRTCHPDDWRKRRAG